MSDPTLGLQPSSVVEKVSLISSPEGSKFGSLILYSLPDLTLPEEVKAIVDTQE